MASLERLGPNKIRETDERMGKVTDVITSEVSADGKTLTVVDESKLDGKKYSYIAKKK